ncbi:MAG: tetratricopeptide repeat protein [Deltaproteobacteria bacterium]|nr:tetratricopeptide repeat protein [Deltaproteobacteria bacterium]
MANKYPLHAPPGVRYAVCTIVLCLSAAAFYALYPRFISQAYYVIARNYHKDGYLGLAVINYKKAGSYQPRDATIWKKLADAQFNMGKKKMLRQAFRNTKETKESYLRAFRYNPLDSEIAHCLARTESRLEKLYDRLHPKKKNNPYHALPYFEKAIHLRPNGISYHYSMARYLYRQNNVQALIPVIRSLAGMYPPVVANLKKEPLWSPSVKKAVKQGVLDTIRRGRQLESAHKAMSSLLAEDKDWPNAIVHFQKLLECKKDKISSQDYIHLGSLYLQNNQTHEANISFIQSLYLSMPIEKAFQAISHIFKNKNHRNDFYTFYREANHGLVFSPKMHVISACYFIDSKQYKRAQQILTELNRQEPTAEAYYWLARIAEKEKDWDQMELNIQKATVLEPSNINYRRMFYGLLKRLGKHETAEREIGLMIRNSENPSPRLFDERAKLRLSRKDYTGAVEDWKSAIDLAPQNAAFLASIAEAYIELGDLPRTLKYYKKAMALNPGNKNYTAKYKKLKGESS